MVSPAESDPGRRVASTRVRDHDGKLRRVTATAGSAAAATAPLKERILERPASASSGLLDSTSPFTALANLWLADLEGRKVADGTRDRFQDTLRLHVLPFFENFALNEITTSRVEWFLKGEMAASYARARSARTLLNLLFDYAMRHDVMGRNPVAGTSALSKPKGKPQALTLGQVAAIREAAATWRTEPGLPGPKPDGNVRDLIELLLTTGMRPGEGLAVMPCDVTDGPLGMVIEVTGTVVQCKRMGAYRQSHPKTDASRRFIPVAEFAAEVVRRRMAGASGDPERTIFANRKGGVLSPPNVCRTFREFLELAALGDSGISLRWYRRTTATVVARAMVADAAAGFLGHTSTAVTEGYYIEPDRSVDRAPAGHLQRTLRAVRPDQTLLAAATSEEEVDMLDEIDPVIDEDKEDSAA